MAGVCRDIVSLIIVTGTGEEQTTSIAVLMNRKDHFFKDAAGLLRHWSTKQHGDRCDTLQGHREQQQAQQECSQHLVHGYSM